jgi:hypothetical protein
MLWLGAMSSPSPTFEAPVLPSCPEQIGLAVERVAVRFVRTWGFSTVEMVATKFRLLLRAPAPRAPLARRALAALPDLAWLDPTREWFTLLDRPSAMSASIEKIVSNVGAVGLEDLEAALGKRHSFGAAPLAVVRAYLAALATRVARRGSLSPDAHLTTGERVVLAAFEGAGGVAALADLRAATHDRLEPAMLTRVLQGSPLFLREGRGTYRLVGTGAPLWSRSVSRSVSRYVTLAGSTTIVAPIQ